MFAVISCLTTDSGWGWKISSIRLTDSPFDSICRLLTLIFLMKPPPALMPFPCPASYFSLSNPPLHENDSKTDCMHQLRPNCKCMLPTTSQRGNNLILVFVMCFFFFSHSRNENMHFSTRIAASTCTWNETHKTVHSPQSLTSASTDRQQMNNLLWFWHVIWWKTLKHLPESHFPHFKQLSWSFVLQYDAETVWSIRYSLKSQFWLSPEYRDTSRRVCVHLILALQSANKENFGSEIKWADRRQLGADSFQSAFLLYFAAQNLLRLEHRALNEFVLRVMPNYYSLS